MDQWGEFIKIVTKSFYTFFGFSHKVYVFIISIYFFFFFFFFDEVSNFHNRKLISQKRESVVSNCQRNCMRANQNSLISCQKYTQICVSFITPKQQLQFVIFKPLRRRSQIRLVIVTRPTRFLL